MIKTKKRLIKTKHRKKAYCGHQEQVQFKSLLEFECVHEISRIDISSDHKNDKDDYIMFGVRKVSQLQIF